MAQVTTLRSVRVAVLLALLSIVPVAWSLRLSPPDAALRNRGSVYGPIDWQLISVPSALAVAAVVALTSAVVGGLIGGRAWRWRRVVGAVLALESAWAVGILTLPIAAASLGVHLRAGIVCIMGCQVLLRDDEPWGGPVAYAAFLASVVFTTWSLIVPVVVALLVGFVLYRWIRGRAADRPRPPLLLVVLALAVAQGLSLIWALGGGPGAIVVYASLAIGVLVWTALMARASDSLG